MKKKVGCNFYIDLDLRGIKTPVNGRKSKQDENLQNSSRTRAKNKRGAQKYPLHLNTLHHPGVPAACEHGTAFFLLSENCEMWSSNVIFFRMSAVTKKGAA